MNLVLTKVLVAFLFGLIRFVFGILPLKLFALLKIETTENGKKFINEKKQKVLEQGVACLQAFGGGVLFATCFLHMMPEVYYSVEELKHFGVLEPKYPYSQLILSCGFFLVYFIEEISQWIVSKIPKEPVCRKKIWSRTSSVATISTIVSQDNRVQPDLFIDSKDIGVVEFGEKKQKNVTDFEDEFSATVDEKVQTEEEEKYETIAETEIEEEKELENIMQEKHITKQQFIRCVFIVMALSFHAILEGLAIGLQHSILNIWYMFIAVAVHSITIQFCIGLELYLSGSKPNVMLYSMMILSSGSPMGVLIGLGISLTTDMRTKAKSTAVVLLEGLSAGTILYITFFEVLTREKERKVCRVQRALCIGIGFTLMAGLEALKIE